MAFLGLTRGRLPLSGRVRLETNVAVPLNCSPEEEARCRTPACMNAQMAFTNANNTVRADCSKLTADSNTRNAYAAAAVGLFAAAATAAAGALAAASTFFGAPLAI